MLYPNHPSRSAGNRHYLYGASGWQDYKDAVISSGVYETFFVHTDGRVLLHFWFNRVLSAGEQTAISAAGFVAQIAAAAGVDAADITVTNAAIATNIGYCAYLTVDTTKAGSAADTFVLPLPSAGTYAYEISWGDGNVERFTANTSQTHVYAASGTYNVAIRGVFPQVYFNDAGDKLKLIGIQIGDVGWLAFTSAFCGCANLVTLTGPANTSAVTNMASMFSDCIAFNQTLPAVFDTSAVTDMSYMFSGCTAYNQSLPASFNTEACENMSGMFSGCTAFNQTLPAAFNTAAVTDMSFMFSDCTVFNQVLPAAFDTSAVTNMSDMFSNCTAFNQPLPASFNTEACENMYDMFSGCTAFNQTLPAVFDTSAVTDMSDMFSNCTAFKQSLAAFNMEVVEFVEDMLKNCNINETGTTTNYDATLIAWAAQDLVDGLAFHGGTSKYGDAGQTARTAIATDDSWTFTDGGHI
jgi:hypothetical protein